MQPAQDIGLRMRMILLHEMQNRSRSIAELTLVIELAKKTPVVFERARFEQQDFRNGGAGDVHAERLPGHGPRPGALVSCGQATAACGRFSPAYTTPTSHAKKSPSA